MMEEIGPEKNKFLTTKTEWQKQILKYGLIVLEQAFRAYLREMITFANCYYTKVCAAFTGSYLSSFFKMFRRIQQYDRLFPKYKEVLVKISNYYYQQWPYDCLFVNHLMLVIACSF